VQQKLASIQVDWRVGLAVLSFVPIFWVIGLVSKWLNGPDQMDPSPNWIFAGLALWAGLVFWEIFMSTRRYLLKNAVPQLAASLAPLKPLDSEVSPSSMSSGSTSSSWVSCVPPTCSNASSNCARPSRGSSAQRGLSAWSSYWRHLTGRYFISSVPPEQAQPMVWSSCRKAP